MQHPHTSIGQTFIAHGIDALNVHRANERRSAEITQARLNADAHRNGAPSPMRRWLGTSMVWLGTAVAGKAATMQEREVSVPNPRPNTPLAASR